MVVDNRSVRTSVAYDVIVVGIDHTCFGVGSYFNHTFDGKHTEREGVVFCVEEYEIGIGVSGDLFHCSAALETFDVDTFATFNSVGCSIGSCQKVDFVYELAVAESGNCFFYLLLVKEWDKAINCFHI